MGVAIDKAWRGEFAMAVNFTGAFGGAPSGIYRKPRYAYCRDLSDDAIFDNDIGRPPGRGSGAIDNCDASKNQSDEWPGTAFIAGGGFDLAKTFLGEASDHFFAYLDGGICARLHVVSHYSSEHSATALCWSYWG